MSNKQVIYIIEVQGRVEDVIADVPGVWLYTDTLDELGECPLCRTQISYLHDETQVCLDCMINWSAESGYPGYETVAARADELRAAGRVPGVFDIQVRQQRKASGRD